MLISLIFGKSKRSREFTREKQYNPVRSEVVNKGVGLSCELIFSFA